MKTKIFLLTIFLSVMLLPLVTAFSITLSCPDLVAPNSAVDCDLSLDPKGETVKTFQFKVDAPAGFTVAAAPKTSDVMTWKKLENNAVVMGQLSNDFVLSAGKFATIHLIAGSSGGNVRLMNRVPDFTTNQEAITITSEPASITVATAQDTPKGAPVEQGQAKAYFLKVSLTGSGMLDKIVINVNEDGSLHEDLTKFYVYSGSTFLKESLAGPTDTEISGLGLQLVAGKSTDLLISADISPAAKAGDMLSLGVSVDDGGTFPAHGAPMTVVVPGNGQSTETIGQRIDKELDSFKLDKTQKSWDLGLVSKIAKILKDWFGGK